VAKARNAFTLRFLAELNDVNYGGSIHGGTVMKRSTSATSIAQMWKFLDVGG